MLFINGFEQAIVGHGVQVNRTVVVYDYVECIRIAMDRHSLSMDDAIEYVEGIIGSWVGEEPPVFLHKGDYNAVRHIE